MINYLNIIVTLYFYILFLFIINAWLNSNKYFNILISHTFVAFFKCRSTIKFLFINFIYTFHFTYLTSF